MFGIVSLVNAFGPVAYYALSYDYSGNYYTKHPNDDPRSGSKDDYRDWDKDGDHDANDHDDDNKGKDAKDNKNENDYTDYKPSSSLEFEKPVSKHNTTADHVHQPRRERGTFDDNVWLIVSILHLSIWGPSSLFFSLVYMGLFKELYATYI